MPGPRRRGRLPEGRAARRWSVRAVPELAEGDGVAAGFGQEVAAVAEHVRPGPAAGAGARRVLPSCQAVVIIRR